MAIHTAVVRLVNVDSDGNVVYKESAIIDAVIQVAGSSHRVFEAESGSAPNAASDGSVTAPTIHEYLTAEDGDGFTIAHLDQYYIVTKQ